MSRDLIIIDIETTGLDPETCIVLEIAAINATTGDRLRIVPEVELFSVKDGEALAINRYFERGVWRLQQQIVREIDLLVTLGRWLDGNTIGGSNPRFDLAVLQAHFRRRKLQFSYTPHHRLADLSAYAAGYCSQPITDLPGLDAVCKMLSITNHEPHSAMGDAEATLECFRKIEAEMAR